MSQAIQDNLSVTEVTGSSSINVTATATESEIHLESGGNPLRVAVDTVASIGTVNAFPLEIRTNEELRIHVQKDGNVGIGAPSSGAKLAIDGNLKLQAGIAVNKFANDVDLVDNNDLAVPTSRAVKTYVDTQVSQVKNYGETQITQVNSTLTANVTEIKQSLSMKAALAGSASQDFQAGNLTVSNNLGVGTTTPLNSLHVSRRAHLNAIFEKSDTKDHLTVVVGSDGSGLRFSDSNFFFIGTQPFDNRNDNGAGRELFRITNAGNVGIGTSNPNFALDVRGGNGWIGSGDSSQSQGGWRLGRWPDINANQWVYLSRADSARYQDLAVGALWAGGGLRFGTADDLAEMTPVKAADNLEPGDVVIITNPPDDRVLLAKTDRSYDSRVAGVISNPETAGLIIGGSHPADVGRDDVKPLALTGRVMTKVTIENGSIQAGDLLTTSSTPGYAMKATKPGYALGKAMQAFKGETGEAYGRIWVLVNLSWSGAYVEDTAPGSDTYCSSVHPPSLVAHGQIDPC